MACITMADKDYKGPCIRRAFDKVTFGEVQEACDQLHTLSDGGNTMITGVRVDPVADDRFNVRVDYQKGPMLGSKYIRDLPYSPYRDGMTPAEVMGIFKGRVIKEDQPCC